MRFLWVILVLLFSLSAIAKKKKVKEVNMEEVHAIGLKKSEEVKEQVRFHQNRWKDLSDKDKKELEKKLLSSTDEEKKIFRDKLNSMSTEEIKTYIYAPKEK